ncbi:hypothetical protein [uncultured Gimesia sp.]|uniref:hypothetical protein n=1 Tax=uncultured Gimesia sp. TaxID=1678688 RepID=UPI00260E0E44|nr:hypothetical protein [uncultured Gimesia sp.]
MSKLEEKVLEHRYSMIFTGDKITDPRWLQYLQNRYGYDFKPAYNVRLRKIDPGSTNSFPPKPQQGERP